MPYDKEKLRVILMEDEECKAIDKNGALYPPTSSVYTKVAEKLASAGSHITARHVYTILNENRNRFKTLLLEKYGYESKLNRSNLTNSSAVSVENESCLDKSNGETFNKCFKLILSEKNWKEMSPVKIISSGRAYWKLKKGWTDIISERICQQHPSVDCVFAFKNNNVTPCPSAQYYATFTGACVECEAKITGTLLKVPMHDVDVLFNIQIVNILPDQHSGDKRRQLRGQRRIQVATKMIEQRKGAVAFGREEARRLKKFGGKNVATIPKPAVLRKAKEKQLLKMHGLEFASPPLNLLNEAVWGKHAGTIHSIALYKFHCIYWSAEQYQIYTSRCKGDAVFTIDATGGIEKRNNKEDPHVFLYQCMLVTDAGTVPVFQMVSADQRSLIIAQFLRHILAKGAPRPPIVVCDFGRAIINAVAEIFGSCNDLQDYLQKCYYAIFPPSPSTFENAMPKTYIRLDVSHLIAMVARWGCLKGKVIAARRMYLRCIGQAYQTSDINTLSDLIESILAVALSEFLGQNKDGSCVPAQKHINNLNSLIEGVSAAGNIDEEYDDEFNNLKPCSDEEIADITNWTTWAEDIYRSAEDIGKQSITGSIINGCYNPEFAQRLRRQLLPYVPLWTGIMRASFGRGAIIATSSSVESEFGNLKNRVFGNKLPMRIDRFVLEHLEYIEGRVIEASTPQDLPSACSPTFSEVLNTTNISGDDLSAQAEKSDSLSSPRSHSDVSDVSQTSRHLLSPEHVANEDLTTYFPSGEKRPITDMESEELMWNENEDWRGLANAKKRRKATYLDKCPEWQFVKDARMEKLPIFLNGNFCGPVKIKSNMINVRNTCAFDSILQLTMSGLANNKTYATNMMDSANRLVQLAFNVLQEKRVKPAQKYYKHRAEILKDITLFGFEDHGRKGRLGSRQKLDVECNATHLAEYLFGDAPSYNKTLNCQCGQKSARKSVTVNVNVDILLCEGLGSMKAAVEGGSAQETTCRHCKNVNTDVIEYGPHLFVDTSIITDSRYTTKNKKIDHHDLNSVANVLNIQDETYTLTGVVNYTPGHYYALVKSGLYWYEYNDIGPVRKHVSGSTEITPHLIMYTKSETKKILESDKNTVNKNV